MVEPTGTRADPTLVFDTPMVRNAYFYLSCMKWIRLEPIAEPIKKSGCPTPFARFGAAYRLLIIILLKGGIVPRACLLIVL